MIMICAFLFFIHICDLILENRPSCHKRDFEKVVTNLPVPVFLVLFPAYSTGNRGGCTEKTLALGFTGKAMIRR